MDIRLGLGLGLDLGLDLGLGLDLQAMDIKLGLDLDLGPDLGLDLELSKARLVESSRTGLWKAGLVILWRQSAWVTAIRYPISIVRLLVSPATLKFTSEVYSLTIIRRFRFADLDLSLFELTRKKGS